MNKYHPFIIISFMIFTVIPAYSGTLVESTDQDGETVITRFDDGNMRADTGEPGVYVLFHLEKEKSYVVDESQHMVMDLSSQMWGSDQEMAESASKLPKARLVEQGKGPTIAGYSTVHYKVMVGEEFCGDEYLSSRAMKETNLQEFGEVMSRMSKQQQQMSGSMAAMMQDPCDTADLTLYEVYLKKGMPMRTVDKDGIVDNEVKRIETNASIPAGFFELPKDYPVMTMEQMMQQHSMSHQQQMQNMPDMSEMDTGDMQKMREQAEQQIQEMMHQMGKQRDAGN